jgi:hypothetical protein
MQKKDGGLRYANPPYAVDGMLLAAHFYFPIIVRSSVFSTLP